MDHPIKRYLQDAIAAEKSFETQLEGFAKEASLPRLSSLFEQHAHETRQQYESLTRRLEELGGSTSTFKSFLAHLFGMSPKVAQLGHKEEERTTQDIIIAYAVENGEVAMYEGLKIASQTVEDELTERLAEQIQSQEQQTADKLWSILAPAAEEGYRMSDADESARETVVRYLQDAEAAERNFEDALGAFSKEGDQTEVQALLSAMSAKARTQHQRLANRLEALGGEKSTSKSILAHLLSAMPAGAQMGQEPSEKNTQHLIITYGAAAAEIAMYEALRRAAIAAGDRETASLAGELQAEERDDHRLAWDMLQESARASTQSSLSHAA